jgi:hypothetical protein
MAKNTPAPEPQQTPEKNPRVFFWAFIIINGIMGILAVYKLLIAK